MFLDATYKSACTLETTELFKILILKEDTWGDRIKSETLVVSYR